MRVCAHEASLPLGHTESGRQIHWCSRCGSYRERFLHEDRPLVDGWRGPECPGEGTRLARMQGYREGYGQALANVLAQLGEVTRFTLGAVRDAPDDVRAELRVRLATFQQVRAVVKGLRAKDRRKR